MTPDPSRLRRRSTARWPSSAARAREAAARCSRSPRREAKTDGAARAPPPRCARTTARQSSPPTPRDIAAARPTRLSARRCSTGCCSTTKRIEAMAAGLEDDRRAARSGRPRARALDAAQRARHRARARAARRHRHHLREPAQRDRRCRRALRSNPATPRSCAAARRASIPRAPSSHACAQGSRAAGLPEDGDAARADPRPRRGRHDARR